MRQNKLYEYAVIRIVPRVEREEFINSGIVVFCKKEKYLKCKYKLPEEKLLCIYPEADIEFIRQNLQSFEKIALGIKCESKIASLDQAERFRWLTATRSTVIQAGKVHPGINFNQDETLDRLFKEYVG